ncbi:MAG TPA: dienelactone hydrolase [Ramlibacter sp.]|jgi:predicted dienelactone hydrolase|uniref:alpha/beta hydrolase family protein n=1 Tax=Ramlibacter sp. TaxID=1917967 RepID=UPI002D4A12AF|nr:dienelactone hydrolase [Ramlibacter sp.]HZY19627.1 dienelactone hydrolase [Ramlibacter sp.]
MQRLLACALLALCAAAHAGTGVTELAPLAGDGPVTVFYPTAVDDAPVERGPYRLRLATDAPPHRGNGRLVVISHGSGGTPWVHSDLARVLVADGFVVAMPLHRGDNARDPGTPGPESWKLRPSEVSRAIDAVAQDPRFAPLLALDKVGMYGMSAGGHTALSLAGGRWSPARLRDHCEAHLDEDFPGCVGLATSLDGSLLDGVKKAVARRVIAHRLDDSRWYTHHDPRIAVVVAGVPFATDFDPASVAQPRVALGLVRAGDDRWLAPRFHGDTILAACRPRCELIADLPSAGHGALLSPPPPLDRLGATARRLLEDPPGFDRSQLPAVDARIAAFLRAHLVP